MVKKKLVELVSTQPKETFGIIAQYLLSLNNYQDLKLKKVADECYVSSATIIRFCKYLGFKGFPQLKYNLQEEIEQGMNGIPERKENQRVNMHLDAIAVSLDETRKLLSKEKLQYIIRNLHNTHRIDVYGLGSSYLVAKDWEFKFDRIGKVCKAYNDYNLQSFSAKNANEQVVCVGITYSGTSKSVIDNLSIAKENGAVTILITYKKNREYDDVHDVVLYVSSSDLPSRLISTTSRLAMMYLNDLIYFAYLSEYQEDTNYILNKNKFM